MRKIFFLAILVIFFVSNVHSQYIHKIKADSVLISNDSCNAELNLENSTKDTLGFLYNKGKGRTEFRRGLIRLYDSLYVIGNDTLDIAKGASGNFIRNQKTAAQTANGWINGTFYIADTTVVTHPSIAKGIEINKSYADVIGLNIVNRNMSSGASALTFSDGSTTVLSSIRHARNTNILTITGGPNGGGTESLRLNPGWSGLLSIYSPYLANNIATFNAENKETKLYGATTINGNFTTATGSTAYKSLNLIPVYNQTGTATGAIYGLYYNPTITSVLGTHYGLYINSGINYLAGRTTIGSSTFLTDETLNVNGTAQVRKTFNSSTPVPAFGSGSSIGITGLLTVNPGTHGNNNIYGVFGEIRLQPGIGNTIPTGNSAGLTGQLVLGDGALVSGGVAPKYSSIYASLSGLSNATVNHDNIAFISTSGGLSTGQTITNLYHLYLGGITGSGGTTGVTNYWGIYQAGGLKNYFNGNVLIGNNTDVSSSKLTVTSTTQGFLIPRMTTTQRNAIASPATGLSIYNTTLKTNDTYNGSEYFSFGNQIILPATNTPAGTTGNQTINKATGTVNIAAAGTTVTVNNNLVSANSIVTAVLRTNDTTAYIKNVVPGAGTITINLGAAATAEVSIGFVVFN